MVITVVQKRNRFSRFLDDKTSVLHNEIRYTSKFSPINWGYSSSIIKRCPCEEGSQNSFTGSAKFVF